MELRHLRYFLAVAEEGSFTRAAAHLHISQPALSQQIRALERHIGGPLFYRDPGGSRLTAAGHALIAPAQRALAAVTDGLHAARALARPGDVLRVGLLADTSDEVIQSILAAFTRAVPDIRLIFRELVAGPLYSALLDNEIDVAFTRLPLDPERHAWTVLFEEPRVVGIHPNHPLTEATTAPLPDVLALPILSSDPSKAPEEINNYWLLNEYRNGEPSPLFTTEALTPMEIAQTIAHHSNVVAISTATMRRRPPLPTTLLRFLDLPHTGLSQAVVARRRDDTRPTIRAFFDLADDLARHLTHLTSRERCRSTMLPY